MSRIRFSVSVVFGFVFSVIASHLTAQQVSPPEVEWEKLVGQADAQEWFFSSDVDFIGNIICAGLFWKRGTNANNYLVKLDKAGNIIWEKILEPRGGVD